MKKILIVLCIGFVVACSDHADSKATDIDRTDNNDTSAKNLDGMNNIRQDTTDTLHKKPQ